MPVQTSVLLGMIRMKHTSRACSSLEDAVYFSVYGRDCPVEEIGERGREEEEAVKDLCSRMEETRILIVDDCRMRVKGVGSSLFSSRRRGVILKTCKGEYHSLKLSRADEEYVFQATRFGSSVGSWILLSPLYFLIFLFSFLLVRVVFLSSSPPYLPRWELMPLTP